MGHLARNHPEELIFGLLADGFSTSCYDGQNFFDTDHPQTDKSGAPVTVSNRQAGTGPSWYLMDTSRAVRPIVWQEREPYDFVSKTSPSDDNVFMNNEFLYGVGARVNAGFGLWQLAFGSNAELTPENYAAARAAMMDFRSDDGRVLGVNPTTLVVPPALESDALHVVNTELTTTGGSKPADPNTSLIERLAALMGLAPDASEEDVFTALESLLTDVAKPDPKKFVPIEALQEALLDRNTGLATMSEDRAEARVKDAMQRGYISPAMKGWATALCTEDEASFDSFLESSMPQFAHLFKLAFPEGYTGPSSQVGTTEADAICQQLGLKSGTLES